MANGLGSSPSQGHRVVFLGETLRSQSASLNQVYKWYRQTAREILKQTLGANPAMDYHCIQEDKKNKN